MRWDDERYVRLYTRDTTTWKLLSWQAKCLLPLLLRKVDRAGIADVGEEHALGIAALTDMPLELVAAALAGPHGLVERGVLIFRGPLLLIPNFGPAQEARASDAQRQREHRARARDFARFGEVSQIVTGVSQPVTPSLAEPSLDDRVSLSGSDAGEITKLSDKDKATRVRALPPKGGTQMEIPGAGKLTKAAPELPDWLPREAWEEWVAHRKASKHPLTPQAIKQQIRDLDKLRGQGHAPGEVIAQSIGRGWRGLFAVDQGGGRRAKQGVSNIDPETKKRYEEAF